jgi:hypothetical protein
MVFSRSLLDHNIQSWITFRSTCTRNGQTSIVSNIMINGHRADRPMDMFTFHVPSAAEIQRCVASKIPPDVKKRAASRKLTSRARRGSQRPK